MPKNTSNETKTETLEDKKTTIKKNVDSEKLPLTPTNAVIGIGGGGTGGGTGGAISKRKK